MSEIQFSNNSLVSVEVKLRSGNIQILHSTEIGAMDEQKAVEFVSGSLPTVRSEETFIFMESTAERPNGVFRDFVNMAQNTTLQAKADGRELSPLEYKFHFYPWFEDASKASAGAVKKVPWPVKCADLTDAVSEIQREYKVVLSQDHYVELNKRRSCTITVPLTIIKELQDYFDTTEQKCGVKFTPEQKNWYVATSQVQNETMKRNFPSTPEEAFQANMDGAIFKSEMLQMRRDNRIGNYVYDQRFPVDTWWDIGVNDSTCIIFTQDVGNRVHCIDFFEDSNEGVLYYIDVLRSKTWKARYGMHVGPHDLHQRHFQTGTDTIEVAIKHGIRFEWVERIPNKLEAIQAARIIFPRLCIDATNCADLIVHLDNYTKEFDKAHNIYRPKPCHNQHSNAADSLLLLAQWHDNVATRFSQYGQAASIAPTYVANPLL
jgi:hypothetical protein